MTFEREVVGGLFVVNILYRAATFDAADCETSGIVEARNNSGLVFERRLYGLEEFVGAVQIDNVDVSVGASNYEKLVSDVHGIDSVLTVKCCDWVRGPEIPILDFLVP